MPSYRGRHLVLPAVLFAAILLLLGAGQTAAESGRYVVQPGDTLYRIALRFGTTIEAIAEVNSITNPNVIYVGQQLSIPDGGSAPPGAPPPPAQGGTYVVQPGDTLYRIGLRYGLSWQVLAQANGLHYPYYIYAGQTLIIPGEKTLPDPPPASTPPPAPPPAPPPGAGGTFLSGVQINGRGNYWGTMPIAANLGVRLVKIQVRWEWIEGNGPGQRDWSWLDDVVNAAGASNLQVLASVLQAPGWARSCGDAGCAPADRQAAADFFGALAGRYCGRIAAIEVWNEQNLDREWGPTPDPGAYTDLLRRAYTAIKSACGSTLVVSGALAPTGVHQPGGCCWDDFTFFQAMVSSGALGYSDCIGAHANANIIPPSWGSESDPRGNHHSWTFKDTVWGYYNIAGGQRRVCVTEFGIATGEGHGGIPPGFEWAAANTLQEQADWLVEGFSLRAQWPIFRMIVVWNLDFYPSAGGGVNQNSPYSLLDAGYGALPAYTALQAVPK